MAIALISIACSVGPDAPGGSTRSAPATNAGSTHSAGAASAASRSVAAVRLTEREAEQVIFAAGYYQWQRDELDELAAGEQEAAVLQEEFIYSCMKEQGFEYFVRRIGTIVWMPDYSVEPEGREWVDIYGIGYSTALLPQGAAGSAVGYLGEPAIPPDISEDSEETRYLGSLSEEEYRRYAIALSGLDPSASLGPGSALTPEQQAVVDRSCQARAEARFPPPTDPVATDDGTFELVTRVQASPEWVGFVSGGWECVRDAGLDVSSVAGIERMVYDRLVESGVDARLGELPSELEPIPAGLAEDLGRVQDYERELADVLWSCGIHPIQEQRFFIELARSFAVES